MYALARLASMHKTRTLPATAAWRVGGQQADGAQQRQRRGHGCSCAAAWLGIATTVALFQAGLCVSHFTCTQELVSPRRTAFIIGGDFQLNPEQPGG